MRIMYYKKTRHILFVIISLIILTGFINGYSTLEQKTPKNQSISAQEFLDNLEQKKYFGEIVNFEFINVNFLTIVKQFSIKFNQSISVSPNIEKTIITSIIYNIPLDQAFVVFLEQNDLKAIIKNDIVLICSKSKNNFYIIMIFIFIFIISFIIYIYKKRKNIIKITKQSKSNSINPLYSKEISKKIKGLFEVKNIYRNENLSLQSLSKELSIQPYILSKIINDTMNKTFSHLLNSYRVKEAKQLLSETDRKKQKKNIKIL